MISLAELTQRAPVTLLVNPAAGQGRATKTVQAVRGFFAETGTAVDIVTTENERHATTAAAAVPAGSLLVSLGGDGFHRVVGSGAMAAGAVLAPIPGGRGNDFIRALGLPLDPVQTLLRLRRAHVTPIDVGRINDIPFINCATFGFDSKATQIANRITAVKGAAVYSVSGLAAWIAATRNNYDVIIDGVEHSFRGWNVIVGNSGRYGGGLIPCPNAKLDDGELDIVLIKNFRRHEFLRILSGMRRGVRINHPLISYHRGTVVDVTAPIGVHANVDGDLSATLPARFTIDPGALQVLAPPLQA